MQALHDVQSDALSGLGFGNGKAHGTARLALQGAMGEVPAARLVRLVAAEEVEGELRVYTCQDELCKSEKQPMSIPLS